MHSFTTHFKFRFNFDYKYLKPFLRPYVAVSFFTSWRFQHFLAAFLMVSLLASAPQ